MRPSTRCLTAGSRAHRAKPPWEQGPRLEQSFPHVLKGRFRADPFKNYMAAAISWGCVKGRCMVGFLLVSGMFRAGLGWFHGR